MSGGGRTSDQERIRRWRPDLAALEAKFAAEYREDRQAERVRRWAGVPDPRPEIRTYEGFASGGARTRDGETDCK